MSVVAWALIGAGVNRARPASPSNCNFVIFSPLVYLPAARGRFEPNRRAEVFFGRGHLCIENGPQRGRVQSGRSATSPFLPTCRSLGAAVFMPLEEATDNRVKTAQTGVGIARTPKGRR